MTDLAHYYLSNEAARWQAISVFAERSISVEVSPDPDAEGWYQLTLTQEPETFSAATMLSNPSAYGRIRYIAQGEYIEAGDSHITETGYWELQGQHNTIGDAPILDLLTWETL